MMLQKNRLSRETNGRGITDLLLLPVKRMATYFYTLKVLFAVVVVIIIVIIVVIFVVVVVVVVVVLFLKTSDGER